MGRSLFAAPLLGALLCVAGCASAKPPQPLLWKVSDGDNAVYLLGSVHLLRPDDYPLPVQMDAAFADAERLRFEVSPEEMQSPQTQRSLIRRGLLPSGQSLHDKLSPKTWQRLNAYAARSGLPLANIAGFKPWLAALVISVDEVKKIGYREDLGLDEHFMAEARKSGKPAAGLETAEEQFAVFDGLSDREQDEMMRQTLDEAADLRREMESLHALWRNGDGDGLYRLETKDMAAYPEFFHRINRDRNLHWLPEIQSLLAEHEGDTLVVVGSLHLLGQEGLVNLLRQKGYRVERL